MLAAAQAVDAVAALIRTVPAYATSVFTDRAWPLAEDNLPAWKVLPDDEEIEPTGPNFPALQQHELMVLAEGYCKAASAIDDAMHAMAANALGALFSSKATSSLYPLHCSMACTRIAREFQPDGQAATGRITLSLRVRFHTYSNAPETIH